MSYSRILYTTFFKIPITPLMKVALVRTFTTGLVAVLDLLTVVLPVYVQPEEVRVDCLSHSLLATSSAACFYKYGRLEYAGAHFLKFIDGSYWIKGGTDSP